MQSDCEGIGWGAGWIAAKFPQPARCTPCTKPATAKKTKKKKRASARAASSRASSPARSRESTPYRESAPKMSAIEAAIEVIRGAMREARPPIRVPSGYDKVCNDECLFSFDTPYSPEGLYVSLGSYQGFAQRYVALDHERTRNQLYVHLKYTKTLKEAHAEEVEKTKPTKLAIGGEGGFDVGEDRYEVTKEHALVCVPMEGGAEPWVSVPLPCIDLPQLLIDACHALIEKRSHLAEAASAAVAWDSGPKRESKYAATLMQLPATKKISADPKDWVCEESGMRENLWLNLSDGHIGSGRRQYDGSGGSNGAMNHYTATRASHPPHGFPLVVKLGTITPFGADVYSYAPDEDDEVLDPKLAEHLAHWGINMMVMEKTELTLEEMSIHVSEIARSGSLDGPLIMAPNGPILTESAPLLGT